MGQQVSECSGPWACRVMGFCGQATKPVEADVGEYFGGRGGGDGDGDGGGDGDGDGRHGGDGEGGACG